MGDRLKPMIEKHDRENARRHRLTGEPVLPASPALPKRWSCRLCWWPAPAMRPETCPACGGDLIQVVGG